VELVAGVLRLTVKGCALDRQFSFLILPSYSQMHQNDIMTPRYMAAATTQVEKCIPTTLWLSVSGVNPSHTKCPDRYSSIDYLSVFVG